MEQICGTLIPLGVLGMIRLNKKLLDNVIKYAESRRMNYPIRLYVRPVMCRFNTSDEYNMLIRCACDLKIDIRYRDDMPKNIIMIADDVLAHTVDCQKLFDRGYNEGS